MAENIIKLQKPGTGGTKKGAPRYERSGFLSEFEKEPASQSLIEEHFSLIFRKSSAGISLASRGGRFIEVNPAFCRFLGYTENELLELTCEEITPTDDHEMLRRMWDNAKEGNCS